MSRKITKHYSDDTLAKQIKRGEAEAFEQLYERYSKSLYFLAKKYLRDHGMAEDAVHEIFVKLWNKKGSLDLDKSIKGFLFTMLKNHLLNKIRSQQNRIVTVYEVDENEAPHRNETLDNLLYREYEDIFKQGLDHLSDRRRQVFELKVQGMTNAEIADKLLISINTVKVQYHQGTKFIREYLKNQCGIEKLRK